MPKVPRYAAIITLSVRAGVVLLPALLLILLIIAPDAARSDSMWMMDMSSCRSLSRYPVSGGASDRTLSIVGGSSCTQGVAVGAGKLWVLGPHGCLSISVTDPVTGDVASVLTLDSSFCGMEVAYGDGYLWARLDNSTVGKVNPSTGHIVSSVSPIGGSEILHIAYGGGFLWIVDGFHCARVRKVDPATGAILQSFVLSSTNCISALTCGGGYLWAAGLVGSRKVSKIDPANGSIVGTIDFEGVWPIAILAYDADSPPTTISAARAAAPGTQATVESAIVTAASTDWAYMESADRSSGIKIIGSPLPPRDRVIDITGAVEWSEGEKAIRIATISVGDPGSVKPLGMSVRAIAMYGPNTGVVHALGAAGLCSVGLLVRTWGTVTSRASGFFYVDDGSIVQDGTGNTGLRILCDGLTPPALGKRVQVTGIGTLFLHGNTYMPALRLRDSADLRTLD